MGVVTLLMACIFMGQWIRIRFAFDQLAPVIQMQELKVQTQFLELHLFWSRFTLLSGFLLTLIAAWLLLSKPRQSTSKKPPEPAANEGGATS